ncbi:hypothetical protein GQR36_11305 [Enterococcus termitis]
MVRRVCLEVQESLEQVEKISIGIPENFFGKEYLREYFSANNLTTNSSKEESFEIKLNGEIKQQYYIWKKENDVYLSIRKPKWFEPIQKMISPNGLLQDSFTIVLSFRLSLPKHLRLKSTIYWK